MRAGVVPEPYHSLAECADLSLGSAAQTGAGARASSSAEGLRAAASKSRTKAPPMKSKPGPAMTLGNAAAAHVRFIVWCRDCLHQIEPDPAEQAERYGAELPVPEWRAKLVCSRCGSRSAYMVVTGTERVKR